MSASITEARNHAFSIPSLLRQAYPRHTAKHVARAADAPLGTAKAWVSGRFVPSAETLLAAAMRCERLAAALEARIASRHAPSPRRETAPTTGATAAVAGEAGAEVTA